MSVTEAVTLISALTAAIVGIGGVVVSIINARQIQGVHTIVNSQATKFETLAQRAGFAEGVSSVSEPQLPHQPPAPGAP
ncbi:MAG TPA: hypothetical protein VKQ30_26355 [Ktedonobacterales bacterium]|nr:hypothetical protein [Ktedonobacterales bacterium]